MKWYILWSRHYPGAEGRENLPQAPHPSDSVRLVQRADLQDDDRADDIFEPHRLKHMETSNGLLCGG